MLSYDIAAFIRIEMATVVNVIDPTVEGALSLFCGVGGTLQLSSLQRQRSVEPSLSQPLSI